MVLPSPPHKAPFVGFKDCPRYTSKCYGYSLTGTYWTEVSSLGKASLHVDAIMAWKKSPPTTFGWGITTHSKKYKMERIAISNKGKKLRAYKEKCSIYGDKGEDCYGKKVGSRVDHWKTVELLTTKKKLRVHAVRELRPKKEKNPHFKWEYGSVRPWSAYLNTGKETVHSEMSMSLYLSDTPGYGWWNFIGMSNIAVFIILFLLTTVIITVILFCRMRKKFLT